MSRRFIQRSASLLVVFMLTFGLVGNVLADAGNPIAGTIHADAVVHPDGSVTVNVKGQWNWLTHNADCNFDRAATGVGIIWNDPTETGYEVSKNTISAEIGVKTKDGSWADPNPLDGMVHPVDRGNVPEGFTSGTFQSTAQGYPVNAAGEYPLGQLFVDPALSATGLPGATQLAAWRGGCGREPLTGADAGQFAGDPWGSWGYETNYSHTFRQLSDISQVCVNFYDVHGGGKFDSGKFQVVKDANEITVDENGDNSIETNAYDVTEGVNCVTVEIPPDIQISKTPDHQASVNAGDPIGFTLTVYNDGGAAATGVKLNDVLPSNAGLAWTIAGQGAGWNNTCAIAAGSLTCGGAAGVTVPGNLTQAASTFTVHITSTTTAATGGNCPGTGTVSNTGSVTTSNDGDDQATATECVLAGDIKIVKTPDHQSPVSAGSPIGFTLTVYNAGAGNATGVKLADVLPTNAGLNWQIAGQGAGWNNTCAIAAGSLTCGGANGVTVPGNLTQANSTFTVHITSTTTSATGGTCPGTGTVTNTGSVTSTNDGSGQSTAVECVQAGDIKILKVADDSSVVAGDPIGFTIKVWNAGSGNATGVKLTDVLPTDPGTAWTIQSQGAGWAGTCAIAAGSLTCGGAAGVTVPGGTTQAATTFTVHIVSPTTVATAGTSPVENQACVATTNDGAGCSSDEIDVFSLTLTKDNNAPDREIELPDGTTIVLPTQDEGKFVTYTLAYDVGASAVHNAVLTDVLPAGVTFQPVPAPTSTNPQLTFVGYTAATRTLTWHADVLSADGSVSYVVKVDAGANKLGQPLINHAAIESEETPEDTAQSEFFVPPPPKVETKVPTGPPTDSFATTEGTTNGSSLLIILSALGLVIVAVGVVTPATMRRRNRR